MSWSQLTNSIIFQRGWYTTNQIPNVGNGGLVRTGYRTPKCAVAANVSYNCVNVYALRESYETTKNNAVFNIFQRSCFWGGDFLFFLFSSLALWLLWLLWLLWVCGFCGFTMLYLSSHLSVYLSNLTSSNQTKPNLILSNIISFYMVLSCFIFPI